MTSFFICCGKKKTRASQPSVSQLTKNIEVETSKRNQNTIVIPVENTVSRSICKLENESFQQSTQNTLINSNASDLSLLSSKISQVSNSSQNKQIDEIKKIVQNLQAQRKDQFDASVKKEQDYVSKLIDSSNQDQYIISMQWAQKYTGFLGNPCEISIGKIDNRTLLKNPESYNINDTITVQQFKSQIRTGLKLDKDYLFLNEQTWRFIQLMYGGGPTIIQDGMEVPSRSSSETRVERTNRKQNYNQITTDDLQNKAQEEMENNNQAEINSQTTIKIPNKLGDDEQQDQLQLKQSNDKINKPPRPQVQIQKAETAEIKKNKHIRQRDLTPDYKYDQKLTVNQYIKEEQQKIETEKNQQLLQMMNHEKLKGKYLNQYDYNTFESDEKQKLEQEERNIREFSTETNNNNNINNINNNSNINSIYSRNSNININSKNKNVKLEPLPQKMVFQFEVIQIWDMRSQDIPIIGLQNQRFFCYMNSALQCVMSISQLNHFYLSGQATKLKGQKSKNLTTAYEDFLHSIEKKGGRNIPVFQASKIQSISGKQFNSYEQHDSHEFILYLLSELQEEICVKRKIPECKNANEAMIQYFQAHDNILDQLFFGQLQSQIYCPKCKNNSVQFDPTFDLSLQMKYSSYGQNECSLEECMSLYFKEELIDDFWRCDNCKKETNRVKRQLKISHSPNILIISFKRFTLFPRKEKIRDNVTYNNILDIKKYITMNIQNIFD